jgi:acylphosphatase
LEHEKTAKRYFVSGMVQGVGYRYFARTVARRLGLSGYVRNLRDGRVEVYAIGAPDNLEVLRKELERGPQASRVSSVDAEDAGVESQYGGDFSIEYDA